MISVSLWDGEEQNCTSYGDVHAINGILQKYIKGEAFFLEDKITAVLAGDARPPWTNTCTLLSTRSCRASSVFWDFTATSGRAV